MQKLELNDILKRTSDLKKKKKVAFVAIIWRPNVGKSSFINSLLSEKISIISKIPQTTRKKILAIYNDSDSQIIFFDNPWIHKSEKLFNLKINKEAISSLKDADIILYLIDSTRVWAEEEKFVKEIIENSKKPVIKVYTKSDLKPVKNLDNHLKISSVTKEGFNILIDKIKENATSNFIPFPEDYYTKQNLNFRISEIIREKVFLKTKEEVPHSIFVWVEEIEEKEKIVKIWAYIFTETDSQKYIVIWKSGNLIKQIWKEARLDLEDIFWKKVFLALRVKVNKNWRKNEKLIKKILN